MYVVVSKEAAVGMARGPDRDFYNVTTTDRKFLDQEADLRRIMDDLAREKQEIISVIWRE